VESPAARSIDTPPSRFRIHPAKLPPPDAILSPEDCAQEGILDPACGETVDLSPSPAELNVDGDWAAKPPAIEGPAVVGPR
jgi:hypothetical protein